MQFLYRHDLQIAALDLTRSNAPTLWLLHWDPTQPVATRPLSIRKNGTWYTYGHDLTKNVTELYKADGTIATAYDYTPYGTVTASGIDQPIQWSSEHYDTELGMVYYNYRHYNPLDGRWINRDPIAEEGGRNLYAFARNRCMIDVDYLGKACCGPDISDWFIKELALWREWVLSIEPRFVDMSSRYRRPDDDMAILTNYSSYLIMLNMGPQMRYFPRSDFRSLGISCPTKECTNTVTLYGKCIHSSEIGNFVYGYVCGKLGIPFFEAMKAAEVKGNRGDFTIQDKAAIKLGYEFVIFPGSVREMIEKYASTYQEMSLGTSKSCKPCLKSVNKDKNHVVFQLSEVRVGPIHDRAFMPFPKSTKQK